MKLLLTSTLEHFGPKLPLVFGDDLRDMDVLYIPTAAYAQDGYERWLMPELESVKTRVKSFTEFDIKDATANALETALKGKDVLYVTGGNTYCLLESMKKIGFGDILKKFLENDGIYFGSSAGSIVTCPDIGFIGNIDDPSKANLTEYSALNLIDFLIMPHMNQEKFSVQAQAEIQKVTSGINVIGLNDDQALWIKDNYIQLF